MYSVIHILGNGPSLSLFNRNEWTNDDLFVGCNFSDPELRPNYTVIMDAKPMMKLFEGYRLTIPAVVSDRCEKYIEKEKGGWRKLSPESIKVIDTIKMSHPKGSKYPMNSGHHATIYAIEQNIDTVKEVHLWGFDSFWTDDISSRSDIHFKGAEMVSRIREPVVKDWRKYWEEIFEKYNDIKFVIQRSDNT